MRLALVLTAALASLPAFADDDPADLPPKWFPLPAQIKPAGRVVHEDFGSEDFTVGKDTVTAKGHHWKGELHRIDPNWDWDGQLLWKQMRPALEHQGFVAVTVDENKDGNVDAVFRKGTGDKAIYVELELSKADAYSNDYKIIEVAQAKRTLQFTPPARAPEPLADDKDFPFITALPGATLKGTKQWDTPIDVTAPSDKETHLAGTGHINKLYDGPTDISADEFTKLFTDAFKAAGWTIVKPHSRGVLAHYAKNGRELWADVYGEGGNRWDVDVADVGSAVKTGLAKDCKVALYGLNFDFNKATLRPDSDPVLQQVLAIVKTDASFELRGHTDNVGDKTYNQNLSQQRADAVKTWLVAHGAPAAKLSAKGFGDTVPLVANDSDLDRAKNRRVELAKSGCH